MAEISLGVELHKVYHAVVERVPEISSPAALLARHAEVVDVAGKVCLAGHANANIVGDVLDMVGSTTVVTVRFVIACIRSVIEARRDVLPHTDQVQPCKA